MRLIIFILLLVKIPLSISAQDITIIGNIKEESLPQLTEIIKKINYETGLRKISLQTPSEITEFDIKDHEWEKLLKSRIKKLSNRIYPTPTSKSIDDKIKELEDRFKHKRTIITYDRTNLDKVDDLEYFADWDMFLERIQKKPKRSFLLNFTYQTVSLTIPKNDLKTIISEFTLNGSSNCNVGKIDSILVKVNDNDWIPALGTEIWKAQFNLNKRDNLIRIKAIGNLKAFSEQVISLTYDKLNTLPIHYIKPDSSSNTLDQCNYGGAAFNFKFSSDIDLSDLIKNEQLILKIEDANQNLTWQITVNNYKEGDLIETSDNKFCLYIARTKFFLSPCVNPDEDYYYYFKLKNGGLSTPRIKIHFSSEIDGECNCNWQ